MHLGESEKYSLLRNLFTAAINAVDGYQATSKAIQQQLANDDDLLALDRPVHLIAIGKAADAMTRGALSVIGARVNVGLVITKHGHGSMQLQEDKKFTVIESGHPTPDVHSLHAGEKLIAAVREVPDDAHLLFLVSGGASALVESLVEPLQLDDLTRLTERLLSDGLPIGKMNKVRRSVSRIKGGKLARFLGQACVSQMLISDVPRDVPADIGSGLLVLESDPESCVDDRVKNSAVELAPAADDPVWQQINTSIIASSSIAQQAVVAEALRIGIPVAQRSGSLDGDVHDICARIAHTLLSNDAAEGLYVWGGETTVVLPGSPGRGGRNQHLALCLAQEIQGTRKISVLCAGTDGTDGPTDDAGGLINQATIASGIAANLDSSASISAADAGTYLDAIDALLTTGPTGTNVMDLVIAYIGD